jgi:hypothetical protein
MTCLNGSSCAVEVFFILICLEVVHGALVSAKREYKLLGVCSSVLVNVKLVEQLVDWKGYLGYSERTVAYYIDFSVLQGWRLWLGMWRRISCATCIATLLI